MQHHDSTPLTPGQLARFSPETIARIVAACTREAVSGSYTAHVEREGLIAAWCELHDCDRAAAISALTQISISGHIASVSRNQQ